MRGKLNLRLLFVVTVAGLVFATGWFFLHRYQKNRRLGDYLAQATRAEEEQKLDRAARLLRAYVLAVPADTDARVRYGGLLEKMGKTSRAKSDALSVYEQALRQAPDRQDARRRAAELAFELGRLDAALKHVTELLAASKNDGRALFLLGACQEAKGQYEKAVESYAASGRVEPKPEAFVRRAGVLKVHLKQEDATTPDGTEVGPQAVLNELVRALPNSYESYLARAAYRKTYDKATGHARARADLETARKIAPDEVVVLFASARVTVELAAKDNQQTPDAQKAREAYWEEARGFLRHGLEKSPKAVALYLSLADVETRAGRRDEAVKVLVIGRQKVPAAELPEVLFALGEQYAEAGDKAGADEALAQLIKLKQDPTRIDFLRGLALVRQGQWYDGSGVLERIRPLVVADSAKAARTDLLLAECYGRLGDIDRQLVTYFRAVKAAPLDWRPRFGLAGALAALGRSTEAIDEYRHITQMERSPTAAWVALARLMVYRNLARPGAERQWTEVSHLLGEAGKVVTDSVDVPILEAEVLVAKGDPAGAKKLLTACRDARPKEAEFWCALATLTDRGGDNKGANDLLNEAAGQIGDTVDLRIARLRVTQYKSAEQAAEVLNGLAADADRFPVDERVRLLRSLASAYWLIDRPAEAGRLWARVAALRPTELGARLLQFDAALKLNDDPGMQQLLAEIRRIEGKNGPLEKYGAATRLIWLAGRDDRSGLVEARALLAAAAARRPGWPRIPLALATIDELEGNTELMVEHLKQGVDLGDRQLPVIKRLAQLLDERGRGKEADDILRRLEAQAPISNDLQRLAAEVSLRLDTDRALALARGAIKANSKDYKERVWLGRILSAGGRSVEAEAEFEAALVIAGDKPEVWVAFIQHTTRQKDKDPVKIDDALKRAEAALVGKNTLALALCYELAGKRDRAEERYLQAVKEKGDDPRARRAVATFYQQYGSPEKAEPHLRQLLSAELKAAPEDVKWARRNLALALGVRPEAPSFDEALRLLDANAGADGQIHVEDLRTRALVTSTRPGRRQEVIALLEQAEKIKPPAPEHEFLLAKLYEAEGNWPKARDRMLRLIGLQKGNAPYLGAFASSLMRRGEYGEAAVWVSSLTDVAPNALATVTLRVRLMCRTGKAADAVPVLRRYLDAKDATPGDPAARALAAADLFDQSYWAGAGKEAADAAEAHYVRHKDLSKRADAALPLASFYGFHDAPDKALALCEEALKTCPLEQVLNVALVATAGKAPTGAHFSKVEGWLTQALAKKPDAVDLWFLLGTLRELQGRFADAEAQYRKVLAKVPTHAGALNNLAFLLAVSGKGPEAVQTAQRAFAATTGAPPELLDTRGVAHTAAGDFVAAKKDFEAALAEDGPANAHFHLAVVYAKLKDKSKATMALRQARNAGLRTGLLHPLERRAYEDLVAELKP